VPTFEDVAGLVREQTNYDGPLSPETTLQGDLGVAGDDLDRLLLAWAARFGADLSGYLPYFHTPEEGLCFGAWFLPPPHMRVAHIPITVGMLREYAECGRWALEYPPHDRPGVRWDVRVDLLLAAIVVGGLLAFVARGCVW
jgi:hypothetical protein